MKSSQIKTTMKMLQSVQQLKTMGMSKADVKKQLVEQILREEYIKLMRDNKQGAGKEAANLCNELISIVERVYA